MASILETFFILFESNDDKIKQGADDAKKKTDDLDQSLSRTDRRAKQMGESILGTFKQIATVALGAFAVGGTFEAIKAQEEYNDQLGLTAKRLAVNVGDLDAWGKVTARLGGSEQGFQQSLDFLNRGMADIATKGTSRLKPFFDELKIKVTDAPKHVRPLFDILGDLSDRLSKMGAQQAAGIGEKLGLDTGTLLMLQSGRRNLEDLIKRQKELGVTSQQDADKAHAFEEAVADLSAILHHLYTEIGSSVVPALTSFFEWVQKGWNYLAQHKGLVEGFFIGVAGVITAVYLPAVIEAIVATLALVLPYLLIAAAIAAVGVAVGLVVDDIQNFQAGNKSVTGELIKSWPRTAAAVRTATDDMKDAWGGTVKFFKAGGDVIAATWNLIKVSSRGSADEWTKNTNRMKATQFEHNREAVHGLVVELQELAKWFEKIINTRVGQFFQTLFGSNAQSEGRKNWEAQRKKILAPKTGGGVAQNLERLAEEENRAAARAGGKPVELAAGGSNPAPTKPSATPFERVAAQPPVPPARRAEAPQPPARERRTAETPPRQVPPARRAEAPQPPARERRTAETPPRQVPPARRAEAPQVRVTVNAPRQPERIATATRAVVREAATLPAVVPAGVVAQTVKMAQQAIRTADTSPLSARAAPQMQQVTKTYQVEISGPIMIETQATDAQGIAGDFADHLNRQMRQALDHFDDGIAG